ncbi:glycoside hydrolase family 108 protein [Mediterranea massiliensis]|uniref:glycoside hydrolase family 108 protein n=1 Tax=Mediterranea massiliensis TaxID=1841865 RepID=UPI0025A41241|nr:glycosyl hydrolase 108 family protein [Mediterranea massiliensis]MDM8338062.1 glycosyl hydrolase 108 family protein [Mediterranea massiliensis]
MAKAELLKPFILQWEGGFVDDPLDRGGATNKGITIGTFRNFYGKDATVEQLKNITDEQWLHIFKSGYWDKWKADDIENQSIADIVVDWAWASGTATSIKQVQKILGVAVDGIVGNDTLTAINIAVQRSLFDKIRSRRIEFVENIVKRNPTQSRFLKGWKNRINSLTFSE